MIHKEKPLAERLWPKVVRPADVSACWEWAGARMRNGYRVIGGPGGRQGRTLLAHRAVWELLNGPVPVGKELDHLCRNRGCVNPDHLEPVARRENWLRGESPSARVVRTAICKQGHPLGDGNVYLHRNGGRLCLICYRATRARGQRRYRARQRAKAAL
jgi:hypothetical protein